MIQSYTEIGARFERDLKSALVARAAQEIPPALSRAVARFQSERRPRPGLFAPFERVAATAVTGVAALVVLVLVSTVVFGTKPSQGGGPASGQRAHSWGTQMASLEADDLTIEVGGRTFRPPASVQVHSDPGSATYRTLEFSWLDGGVEMRLNVYFGADDVSWWVDAVRTYDGTAPGDWVYYVTPQIRAGLGQGFEGDVDVMGIGLHGIGRLRVSDLRLSAFAAGTIPHSFAGCRAAGPVSLNQFQPVAGQMNPDIPGLTLSVGMHASAAEGLLRGQGICYEFRREFPAENQGQIWCSAPPGDIREWALDSRHGGVILFVEAEPRETLPPNWPQVVGC